MLNDNLKEDLENIVELGPSASFGLFGVVPTVIKAILTDPERNYIKNKCKKYKGEQNKICKKQVRIEMMKKHLSKIPGYRAKCSQQKNPEKCITFLKNSEAKVRKKIAELERQIRSMR